MGIGWDEGRLNSTVVHSLRMMHDENEKNDENDENDAHNEHDDCVQAAAAQTTRWNRPSGQQQPPLHILPHLQVGHHCHHRPCIFLIVVAILKQKDLNHCFLRDMVPSPSSYSNGHSEKLLQGVI